MNIFLGLFVTVTIIRLIRAAINDGIAGVIHVLAQTVAVGIVFVVVVVVIGFSIVEIGIALAIGALVLAGATEGPANNQ